MVSSDIVPCWRAIVAVLVCISVVVASELGDQPLDAQDLEMLGFPQAAKRQSNDDLTKILLKKLRFRDTGPVLHTLRQYRAMPKSKRQEMLMNNLAALLSGLKQRQAEPNLRMPSLRFG